MRETIVSWLQSLKLSPAVAEISASGLTLIGVILVCLLANLIAKRGIISVISKIVKRSQNEWDDLLVSQKVFNRLSFLVPALIFYTSASLIFPDWDSGQEFVRKFSYVMMMIVGLVVFNSILTFIEIISKQFTLSKNIPVRSYFQVIKIIMYGLVGILIISTIMQKSPWAFLSGLGAMTAIILLVFKDSILGFVASIQLSANDLVRPGDWIEMPKYGADGDVLEVTLTSIKVQNFDKTITTIPTYALISDSFKNWRGMSESGGRRIKRAISLDMSSVRLCDAAMVERFKRVHLISEYIDQKESEIATHNQEQNVDTSVPINGRSLSNLGCFRAYVKAYLANHPKISESMTFLVRQLPPSPTGVPIEIYVFSTDKNWINYEGIQADIFDHIIAVIPEFDLRVFQNPTGHDFAALASS